MQTLYDKYGGFATVSKLVHAFYDELLDSDVVAHYFEGTDMPKLIEHQTAFLCKVLGGPDGYTGRDLASAHKNLDISAEAFDEVARILQEVLEDGGVEDDDVDAVLGIVGSTREQIVKAA